MSRRRMMLDPLIEGYLSYLQDVRRQSAGTVSDVRCTLRGVSSWVLEHAGGRPLWKVELEVLLSWMEAMREAGRTAGHLAKNVSHLRCFLDYALRSGRCERNVLDGFSLPVTAPREPPEVLTQGEARQLLVGCGSATAEARAARTMVLVLYGCGLRTSELCNLDVQHVDRERRELLVKGKGDRERHVPVPSGVWSELAAFLLDRGGVRGALFRTPARRRRVDVKFVSNVVRGCARRAGLARRVTPKTLRHSYATHLMEAGVDLAVISELMGHRCPTETGVYLHALGEGKRRAVTGLSEEVDR